MKYPAGLWSAHFICHSNGCELARRAIVEGNRDVGVVSLIAPATEADMDKNGLNAAASSGRIGKLRIFWGSQDSAMRMAKFSQWLTWLPNKMLGSRLGYGTMGLAGPTNARCSFELHKEECGHSDWFVGTNRFRTMERACSIETLPGSVPLRRGAAASG